MNHRKALVIISFFLPVILTACGTSIGTRYAQEQVEKKEQIIDSSGSPENFDLTKYHSRFNLKDAQKPADSSANEIWYSYHSTPVISDSTQTVVQTLPGYRVLVLSTDNLDDANSIKSDVYFRTNHSPVYLIFDPPFYKVETGDFTNRNDAQNFSFKLKQMGYNDVRVINETVNKYK